MSIKFVYLGYDFMLHVVRRLITDGHDLAGVFTFDCDNIFNFNTETLAMAARRQIPLHKSKPQNQDIENYVLQGVTVFLSAGYPFKIPSIDPEKAYGINVHPSLLPKGRGLMPTPTILMHEPAAAGITAHKITENYDAGDIIDQIPITIDAQETVETYSSKTALATPDMISKIFADLKNYWALAQAQDETIASHFKAPDNTMRTLDWTNSIENLDKQARAFGRYGCLATINNHQWVIYTHNVWQEEHNHAPGALIIDHPRQTVIAAANGYFCIKEGHKIND